MCRHSASAQYPSTMPVSNGLVQRNTFRGKAITYTASYFVSAVFFLIRKNAQSCQEMKNLLHFRLHLTFTAGKQQHVLSRSFLPTSSAISVAVATAATASSCLLNIL